MISFQEIKKALPHRYPMLLIDKAISFEKGKSITCIKNVTGNEHFFVGHFPNQPVLPGVFIIESIAQSTLWLMIKSYGKKTSKNDIHVLGMVNLMRFIKPIFPGDQMEIKVEVIKLMKDKLLVKGQVFVERELAAQGNLGFGIIKRKTFE